MSNEEKAAEHCLDSHSDHAASCAYCGRPLSSSDVEDYGTLCERCYLKEYYGSEE